MNPQIENAAVVVGPLLILGAMLKHAFPKFPNRAIPLVTLALGTIGYLLKSNDWTGPNIFNAILVALAATGTHSSLKNLSAGGSGPNSIPPAPLPPRAPMILLLGCIGALTFTGCASTPQGQRVQSAVKVASYVGTAEFLRSHPEARLGFESARDALMVLEESETIDLASLLAIVHRLPVRELRSERAVMVITSATILLSDFAGEIPLDKLDELKPVAKAIREGIELGLGP